MRSEGIFVAIVLFLVVFGTFTACEDTHETEEPPIIVPGTDINSKMRWLATNAQHQGRYIIEIDKDENIIPTLLSYGSNYFITITLKGIGSNRIISLSTNGSMFIIDSFNTLILDENIELKGRSNNLPLIRVDYHAHLIMNHRTKITGNSTSVDGGGVSVTGTFTMNGGEISGNTAYGGGGVYVGSIGTFTMNDGEISGNTASYGGGGVFIRDFSGTGNPSFTKIGGTIFGYSEEDSNSNVVMYSETVLDSQGHAVYYRDSDSWGTLHKGKDTTSGPDDYLFIKGYSTWAGEWDF
jgi:hypothetical protein